MADLVDITGSNDFTEEKLKLHRNTTREPIKRGACLFCKAKIQVDPADSKALIPLWCDSDCKEDHERETLIQSKTNRMLRHA